jgi:hypothetical protein
MSHISSESSPPARVLAEFGATAAPTRLAGGRGHSWAAGDIILKPLDLLPEELDWLARASPAARGKPRLEFSLPLRGSSGHLIEDGWTAFRRLAGEPDPSSWHELAAVARSFACSFETQTRPAFIDARMHSWARADRLAWGEPTDNATDGEPGDHGLVSDAAALNDALLLNAGAHANAAPHLAALAHARQPVSDPSGIVHGDLTGNVLFDRGGASAVIDLTIYWRPVEYSVAIIAIDSVCFGGAPLTLLESISPAANFPQHLIRALLFREATDWFNQLPPAHFAVYDDAVERVLALASR